MAMKKIPIFDATPAQLRYYADTILGIDGISKNHSGDTLLAKIMAVNPDTTEIDVEDDVREHDQAEATDVGGEPGTVDDPNHFSNDPRVEVTFAKTGDVTKPRLVQLAVNGDVVVAKRGEPVKLPYRFYLANLCAIETIGRETDEVDPQGMPVMEFAPQPSYPMESVRLPSLDALEEWHKREGSRIPWQVKRDAYRAAA